MDQVYKFFKTEFFFDMLEKKALYMASPSSWDDPFEQLLSKIECPEKTVTASDGTISIGNSITNDIFAICFTKKKSCDGLWRNYTSLTDGVKVTFDYEKILTLLKLNYESKHQIREVTYENQLQIFFYFELN